MTASADRLTEKEKETLRLFLRGHDAKSSARELDLSVHTINERLRSARRKLDVTSSREAARVLFESEGGTYENLAYDGLGDAESGRDPDQSTGGHSRPLMIAGVFAMFAIVSAMALAMQGPSDIPPQMHDDAHDSAPSPTDLAVEKAARDWLALGDAENWQASHDAAGESFRTANSVDGWAAASRQVRVPLGPVLSRTLVGVDYLNAPPHGFQEVTFHTRFANNPRAVETVTLVKEGDEWKVVGILID